MLCAVYFSVTFQLLLKGLAIQVKGMGGDRLEGFKVQIKKPFQHRCHILTGGEGHLMSFHLCKCFVDIYCSYSYQYFSLANVAVSQ